jgi:hypothetical protein
MKPLPEAPARPAAPEVAANRMGAAKKRGCKNKPKEDGATDFDFGANVKEEPAEPAKTPDPAPFDPADLTAPAEAAPAATGPAGFDPEDLRVTGGAGDGVEVKKMQLVIPVTKPKGSVFVRTHPTFRVEAGCLEIKGQTVGGELYLLAPAIKNSELKLDPCYRVYMLRAAVTRQGTCSCGTTPSRRKRGGGTAGSSPRRSAWRRPRGSGCVSTPTWARAGTT